MTATIHDPTWSDPDKETSMTINQGDPGWEAAIQELRAGIDANLRPDDFRGLAGRTHALFGEFGEQGVGAALNEKTVIEFVGDYAMAVTGQQPRRATWAHLLPETDPGRVLP